MKFAKIFDMTDDEDEDHEEPDDNEANDNLQYDDALMMEDPSEQGVIKHDLEALIPESKDIMSDWKCSMIRVAGINSDEQEKEEEEGEEKDEATKMEASAIGSSSSMESMDSFYKPEADQSEHEQILSQNVVSALNRDTRDYATIARDIDERDW